MRVLLLSITVTLLGPAAAHSHWPIADVLHLADAPFGRSKPAVPLVSSADQKISELLRASESGAEYAITIGEFLQEPLPDERLFNNDDIFAPELARPSRSEGVKFGGVVIGR